MQPATVETSFRTGRVLISLLVWLLCAPGIFFHCAFAMIAGGSLLTGQHLSPFDASEVLAGVFGVITLFAWVALGWMDYRWTEDRTFHWAWPAFGTVIALVAAVFTHILALIFAGPGILLATYLCIWHIRRTRRDAARAAG